MSNAVGAAAGYCGVVQYPSELENHLTLSTRNNLHIRPLRRSEDSAILDLYRQLSARTRYLRFASAMPDLPDSILRLITGVDYHRRLALLAESDMGDGTEVVALSEFTAIDDHIAEVGIVVRDDWQRLGLGTALAHKNAARGRDQRPRPVRCAGAVPKRRSDAAPRSCWRRCLDENPAWCLRGHLRSTKNKARCRSPRIVMITTS